MKAVRRVLPLLLISYAAAVAHVGSPDVFHEGEAGPYRLLVAIRPPVVIPGVAEIEIRTAGQDVREVHIVPLPLTGPGAKFAPVSDLATRSKDDPNFYTGSLWMMTSGSWQVRISADGTRGKGTLSVPVPALASRTEGMQRTLGILLFGLMMLLVIGAISILGASVREGQLEPGLQPDRGRIRKARIAMTVTAVVLAALLYLGNNWWNAEAGAYDRYVFKPLQATARLEEGVLLRLQLEDPGWLNRRVDDLLPDHNHLMHMYMIRLPEMDRVWHLHPEMVHPGTFVHRLPPMPAGRYQIYGDIVHANGLPETVTTEVQLPEVAGKPLSGDDSAGSGPPLSSAGHSRTTSELPDGFRMVWARDAAPLRTRQPTLFRFRLETPEGKPANRMELYMGMPGHAAFVRTDLSVFAHVHPSGSVPMAALGLVEQRAAVAGHELHHDGLPPVVTFPYGFPQPGNYRIYVQMKRAGKIDTGVFDAKVEN